MALNLGQMPASLVMLALVERLERRLWPFIVAGTFMMLSVAGLVFTIGKWTIFWAASLGCALGAVLVLTLALPPLLCGQKDLGRVSAAIFTVSYTMAVVVVLISGAV